MAEGIFDGWAPITTGGQTEYYGTGAYPLGHQYHPGQLEPGVFPPGHKFGEVNNTEAAIRVEATADVAGSVSLVGAVEVVSADVVDVDPSAADQGSEGV